MNCKWQKLIYVNFIQFISWFEHLEVRAYIKWYRTRPIQLRSSIQGDASFSISATGNLKVILHLFEIQTVFPHVDLMLFVPICRGHNWNKCTVATFHFTTQQKWALKLSEDLSLIWNRLWFKCNSNTSSE